MTGTALFDEKDPREGKTYYLNATPVRNVLTAILEHALSLVTSRLVKGAEHLPASSPVILAANHLAELDVLFMQFSISRPIFFMGKEELFRNPLIDWLFRQLGGFPVRRGGGDDWAMLHAQRVLEHDQVLGMFPEGTRSRGKGLHTAKTGVARLSLTMGCPIVPLALHGPQYMFRHFPRRTKIHVTLGAPIYPEPGETHLALTDRVMFALSRMLPPEARGVYWFRPPGF